MILLPSASYNRYLRNFICLPRATGCADRICSFKGSAGLPEKEPLRLNDTYYNDPDIKPQTNLTSQQLIKFAWQVTNGMSYLSSIPASDEIIL